MNILVIRMHRFGDILQLTPMLWGLKEKYPGCRITFLTSSDMAPLLVDNPNVDEVISFPEKRYRYYLKNKPDNYPRIYNEMYDLISDLKKRNFQIIINRHYEFGGILAYLIGAKQIMGSCFSPEQGLCVNDPVSRELYEIILTNRKRNRRNLVDWNCRIAGLSSGHGKMDFPVTEIDFSAAERLLTEHLSNQKPLVAVQMGAAKSFRRWGTENYIRVIQWLIESKGKLVILLGSEDEREDIKTIRSSLGPFNPYLIDLIGKTDFQTLGGILKKCQRLITGDTGTMHMAAAVGTPVISIFYGTAYPWETGPYGTGHLVIYANEPCAPCLDPEVCTYGQTCRKSIQPYHVFNAFELAEQLTDNTCDTYLWPTDSVRLFVTNSHPEKDQELIPIEKIHSSIQWDSFAEQSQWEALESINRVQSGFDRFLNKGEQIIRTFYRGNIEDFLEAVPEYVEQRRKMLAFLSESHHGYIYSKESGHQLIQALNQACQAMATRNYSAFVDVIQYQFEPMIQSAIQGIQR